MSKRISSKQLTGMHEEPKQRVRRRDDKNIKPKAKGEKGTKPVETKKQTMIRSGLKKLAA